MSLEKKNKLLHLIKNPHLSSIIKMPYMTNRTNQRNNKNREDIKPSH